MASQPQEQAAEARAAALLATEASAGHQGAPGWWEPPQLLAQGSFCAVLADWVSQRAEPRASVRKQDKHRVFSMTFSEKDENQRLPYQSNCFSHHCLSFTHKGLMEYILVWRLAGPLQKPPGVTRWQQRQFLESEGSENHLGNPSFFFSFPLQ